MPHLKQLVLVENIQKVLLVTLEREDTHLPSPKSVVTFPEKVQHRPIYLKSYKINLLSKILDFVILPKQLKEIIREEKIDQIIGIGTLAGTLAHLTAIPYLVSFYEPHAAYMLQTNVWKRYDLRYVFQKRWEKQQAFAAKGLIVVSEAYKTKLLNQKGLVVQRICIARNAVDQDLFSFLAADRVQLRESHCYSEDATVGIYVGKYGGLYYEQEAFQIYERCFETISNFRLIILSPQPEEEILQYLEQSSVDRAKVYIASVPHAEVPQYLSAADFAFATIKSYPSARYCSPVKIGEYWASGLPVLLTEGVGDDSDIIKREGGGAVFNLREEGSLEKALQQIQKILKDPTHRQEIPKLARKYRSPDRIREAYEYFFGQSEEERR